MPFNRDMDEGITQGYLDRWGKGIYIKVIDVGEKVPDNCYYLHFEGVYENSTVKVNGRYAGGRKYGYSSFSAVFTGMCILKRFRKTILIKVAFI